jgi:hypothetical protein
MGMCVCDQTVCVWWRTCCVIFNPFKINLPGFSHRSDSYEVIFGVFIIFHLLYYTEN